MKGIHVEDPSMHEFQSFSSSQRNISSVAEEKGDSRGGVDCLGKLLCSSPANWGMHYMSKMVVPAGDKNQHHDAYVCRGIPEMGTIHRDDQQSPVDDVQVSMEAVMKNGYVGGSFEGYMCNEGDYGNNVQAPIAHIKGSHSGRLRDHMGHQDNYFSDFQTSMEALHCNFPAGDNSLWRFLPSNNEEHAMDYFSCDDFRMYEFKVRRCMRGRSHDWTECPFAHPGEKARRRDPRRFHYSGTACPDFRRGTCRRGDSCELSHGVFECWLHPARYRTQLCKDSKSCKRRVCFFAHSPSQLRFVSPDPVPNNGFAHNPPPLASLTDAMASYSDVPHKHSSFFAKHLSPTRQGSFVGHGADGFLDNFSPRNIPGFFPDVVHDGFAPMTSHSHSLNHSRRAPSDRNFEGFSSSNCHIQGLSKDDLPINFQLHSPHDHSCSYIPSSDALLLDDFEYQASHGHSYPHEIPSSDTSSLKTSLTHVNLRNQLALASLASHLDQIMSPTSPLIGHVFSPPPLSPPLSPSESPPMSPGNGLSSWSTTLSRKIASISGHPVAFDGPSQIPSPGMDPISNGTSPAVNHFQASLLANIAHGSGATMFASARGPSPLSTYSLGDQTHDLDGLTMPTPQKDESLHSASMETHPAHAMAHLISTLQQMELRRAATMDMKSSGRSSYPSKSNPNSPKARLEASQGEPWEFASHHRVKSGQGLRATIYGKLGKEAGFDVENPDLGWVNELVK